MTARRQTPARKACDRAARDCIRAWESLTALMDHIPYELVSPMMLTQMRELRELGELMEVATWPDQIETTRRASSATHPDLFSERA